VSADQAPAPVVASSRNAKQNITASSPPFAIGQKLADVSPFKIGHGP
jgi:hypothetical protein